MTVDHRAISENALTRRIAVATSVQSMQLNQFRFV